MANTISLPDGIQQLPITKWQNGHQNFTHTFKKNCSFKLTIPKSDKSQQYHDTTKNFQWLIQYAIDNDIEMRAMGNGWSFSEVAVCEGGMVDTKSLRLSYNLKDSFVAPEYIASGKKFQDLFFVECGMSVLDLNEKLEQASDPKRCIKASGASNGQSIAGCTSTGTHGSAYKVGAVHDTIIGLHIIVGPDRHVWLEKESNPVASAEFIEWLGAEVIRDDEVFNSAVVSFGSFGFIHGVLLETEPIFLLQQFKSDKIVYNDDLKFAINNLEFSGIKDVMPAPAPGTESELYHFEVLVNPQQFEQGNVKKGVYLKTLYKLPYRQDYPKINRDDKGTMYGDDLLGLMQRVLDALGSNLSSILIPPMVNKLLPLAFKTNEVTIGTIGEIFSNTKFRGKAASAAIGINVSDATRVIEEIVAINKKTPFPGAFALRFVKGTQALMGFTHFEKTCILELDGVDSGISRSFFKKVWLRLEELEIPFTLHWGKLNFDLTPDLIKKMYGGNIDKWKTSRKILLDEKSQKVFTNNFMIQCGLAD
ncbi:MAG: FAD-linked oxidase [Ginsengibacter sp.]